MQPSLLHILVVVLVLVLLFGRGKISDLMGDVATGIKNFKKGLMDDDGKSAHAQKRISKRTPKKKTDKTRAP